MQKPRFGGHEHKSLMLFCLLPVGDLGQDINNDTPMYENWQEKALLNALANQFSNRNIVPVIGPEFLVDDQTYPGIHNPEKILLKIISRKLNKEDSVDFPELIFDRETKREHVAQEIIDQIKEYKFTPSKVLKDFLQLLQFPFVITTSFTSVVEDAMKEIWGNVKVKIFDNDPSHKGAAEIISQDDFKAPTIYYMFGKAFHDNSPFVITDTDMLLFCRAWMDPSCRPERFLSVLRTKYLLFMGNGYSDWLYRFIWLSLKGVVAGEFGKKPGAQIDSDSDEQLMRFIKRIDAYTLTDPYRVIQEIKDRTENDIFGSSKDDLKFTSAIKSDVFISYSWTNKDLAEKLYLALKKAGLSVWYDKLNLGLADEFMEEIKKGIKWARCFVPLVTKDMEGETKDEHTYRDEWDLARTIQNRAPGRKFIIPIIEEGMDIDKENKAKIIDEIKNRDSSARFNRSEGFDELAEKIKKIIQTN